jgi:hypothetical protein
MRLNQWQTFSKSVLYFSSSRLFKHSNTEPEELTSNYYLSRQCGLHVTVYKYAIVSLHAQDDVNKYWALFCVYCDVKLHIVQYVGVCIKCAKLEDIV